MDVTKILTASPGKFCIVGTDMTGQYPFPYSVNEFDTKEEVVSVADKQNENYSLSRDQFLTSEDYIEDVIYRVYDDKATYLRGSENVDADFVAFGM